MLIEASAITITLTAEERGAIKRGGVTLMNILNSMPPNSAIGEVKRDDLIPVLDNIECLIRELDANGGSQLKVVVAAQDTDRKAIDKYAI